MKVLDYARKAPAVSPSSPLAEAANRMLVDASDICLVADGDYVVGLLTTRDLVEAAARGVSPKLAVVEALRGPPLLLEGYEPLWKAAEVMLALGVDAAVVTVGGRCVGVLRAEDIAGLEGQLSEASAFAEVVESYAPPA
ncbi:MAG: cyclic nucleotide-binding/CBS domain-containing protein [Thermoproteus sp. AZ2]|uniref:Cyclic nucleotide-binding/CBS domain-containing protein n=1 Tax=Thermoproteus sp. AZ2 TaxID=1609232 RepID=A0ACC6V2H6_9CREN|nr:MAG: signal transduction protein [Thermoproteus sp. AZ2]